jgi:hypothetical protein
MRGNSQLDGEVARGALSCKFSSFFMKRFHVFIHEVLFFILGMGYFKILSSTLFFWAKNCQIAFFLNDPTESLKEK